MPFSTKHLDQVCRLQTKDDEPILVLKGSDLTAHKLVLRWMGANGDGDGDKHRLERAFEIAQELRIASTYARPLGVCADPDVRPALLEKLSKKHREILSTLTLEDDEPIFVLRARDAVAPQIDLEWIVERANASPGRLKKALAIAIQMRVWARASGPVQPCWRGGQCRAAGTC